MQDTLGIYRQLRAVIIWSLYDSFLNILLSYIVILKVSNPLLY